MVSGRLTAMFYYGDGGPNDAQMTGAQMVTGAQMTGAQMRLLMVVDDLLFFKADGYEVAHATVTALRARFGNVTSEREPYLIRRLQTQARSGSSYAHYLHATESDRGMPRVLT